MTSVFIATARPKTRAALTALIASEPALHLAGSADALGATIRLIRDLRPDAVLVDRTVLGPTGAGRLTMLASAVPATAVFLIGMGDHPGMQGYARDAGAAGYIRLDEAPERLSGALALASAA
jgi:DNA-binding NarL/FixJ family response regulator